MDEFISNLQNIILHTKKKISGNNKGSYKSNELGNSFDFHGHRAYFSGDDIRRIDWKTFLRTEDLYIREFTEQKQMQVNIFIDTSGSMDFGNPNKLSTAQMIALGLSYITLNNQNKLSLYSVNNEVNTIREKLMGKEKFYELIKPVHNLKAEGKTDFETVGYKTEFKSGMTFIISDLFCEKFTEVLDFLSIKGQDVVIIHLLSPEEMEPEYSKDIKFVDKETGEKRMIKLDHRIKAIYKKRVNDFIVTSRQNCEYRSAKYILASTDEPLPEIIYKAVGVM